MQAKEISGLAIQVRGIVQGVGFRPFVFQLAKKNGLTGWVRNSSNGVEIEINGVNQSNIAFLDELTKSPPPLARIDRITHTFCQPDHYTQFSIIESESDPDQFIPVSPDISTCADCLAEMSDPFNRRYQYPFINCTNCGPRFTIVKDIPYDRPFTTMADFPMCTDCQHEYDDPLDRRFHAQPTACPICGPSLSFISTGNTIHGDKYAMASAREALRNGQIVAVKGLGGFHLACDALNHSVVEELRRRKKRIEKPFALMVRDTSIIKKFCLVSDSERQLLESRQRPIVLLSRRGDCRLPDSLAPGQNTLGFMLPYTPLHHLLLEKGPDFPEVLVMTSGNISEEPIAYLDHDAQVRLSPLADAFLTHNRDIHVRMDDSVMRVADQTPVFIRRSRGFAPDPILLPFDVPPILAVGAELKNHFTLTREVYAFQSHFIGDLENYETLQSFEEGIKHFENLFRVKPEIIACDLHPDYLSTRYAMERSRSYNLPLIQVQHHHAHLAACLVENSWKTDEPVIGLTFDGTGLGTDGTIWGGEVLVGGYTSFSRRFHLNEFLLPGGDRAVRFPSRTALALLAQSGIDWDHSLPPVQFFAKKELDIIHAQINKKINSPETTSMGRLFDAVATLLGVRQQVNYEGQAAIEMEGLCDPNEKGMYPFSLSADLIETSETFQKIMADIKINISKPIIAAKFHNTVIQMCNQISEVIRLETGLNTVALSGGVWQNKFLYTRTLEKLQQKRFRVLIHKKVPTNDACISLGQSIVAARSRQ